MNNVISLANHRNVNNSEIQVLRKGTSTSDNFDEVMFPVEKRPIEVAGKIVDSHQAIYRPDIDKTIAIVGNGYKLLHNREIFGAFDDAIKNSELDTTGMKRIVDLSNNGQKTYCRYQLPAHEVSIGTKSDKTVLEFCAINSYDGSTSFNAFAGGYRLICSNGQVIGDNLSFFRGRHTKNLEIDHTVDKFRIAAEKFTQMGDEWERWAVVGMDELKILEILTANGTAERLIHKIIAQFHREATELGHTQWALFNALTQISTHSEVNKGAESNAPTIRQRREETVKKILVSKEWRRAA